jgi:hypothetical protein
MRYYIDLTCDFKTLTERLKNKIKYEKKTEKILLTDSGLFKYIKNDLFCFKVSNLCETAILNNYIGNINIIKTNNLWKKTLITYQIPYNNIELTQTTYTFLPYEKKDFKFIIEMYDNGKIDYFFETYEKDENNFFLKENIETFLKLHLII